MTDNNAYKKRVRTRMALTGEKFSVAQNKVSYSSDSIQNLSSLFEEQDEQALKDHFSRRGSSFFVVAGSSGSGKTTVLASLMQGLPEREYQRIMLIEENAEISKLTSPYDEDHGLIISRTKDDDRLVADLMTYGVRMRPDEFFVGELRTQSERKIFLNIANTGHTVASTIHADPLSITNIIGRVSTITVYEDSKLLKELLSMAWGCVIQQMILSDSKGQKFILNSVLPGSKKLSRLIYVDATDEEYEEYFASVGVVTLKTKVDKLLEQKVIRKDGWRYWIL